MSADDHDTSDLLEVAGINRESWQRLCNLLGDNEIARAYRGGWALRRLRTVINDNQEEKRQ